MAIYVHESPLKFHLTDGTTFSRILEEHTEPDGNRTLLEVYFGAAVPDVAVQCAHDTVKPRVSFDGFHQCGFQLLPTRGRGDFRPAMISIREENGSQCPVLRLDGWEVMKGKPELPGMPSTYVEAEGEAETLVLRFVDDMSGAKVTLNQSVMNTYHALTSSMQVENGGSCAIHLEKMASMAFHQRRPMDILHLHGAWGKERHIERISFLHGTYAIESVRGASGHQHNPFIALMSPDATEFAGLVVGVSLIYSGSFLMEVDGDTMDCTRVTAGIHPCTWTLAPGECFFTPEAVAVVSLKGLNGMSQTYHKLYRQRLCRGEWRDKPRPVLVNNWEGTYFDFREEKLLSIAKRAADLGIELFVLDDGWFGQRNSDNCSLGDWVVNREKLPNGLEGLRESLHQMGLMFGLWVEPEMISRDSDLYRAHPDWCLHAPNRFRTEERQQLVLDMSRTDVQDYLIDTLSALFTSAGVDYIKWDMNRNWGEVGSALLPAHQQPQVHHRYILGLYRVLDTLTRRFPHVLFESCSGGGGRFDPGMLAYMPQTWTSDDTDGVERLMIQYGTSVVYPASAMGAHVSAVPNHQVGRVTSLKYRGDVALGGNMGYELDLSILSEEELAEMKRQVERVKRLRHLTMNGRFTRLASPFASRFAAWEFASDDAQELLVCVYQRHTAANPGEVNIPVLDVDENAIYQDDEGNTYAGALLKHQGFRVPFGSNFATNQDYESAVLHLSALPK